MAMMQPRDAPKFFNTAGPINPEDHYCLPPLQRWDLDEVLSLIAQKKYFVLHAPRQTGKTSCLLALRDYLNHQGHYMCAYVNVEPAQALRERVASALGVILDYLSEEARRLGDRTLEAIRREVVAHHTAESLLGLALSRWAAGQDRPLVLLIDEIDSLVGDTLIAVLRQLREGYPKRPTRFPLSIILCGVRDVRDYRIHSAAEKMIITGGSAFNVKAESLRLGDFTRQDVEALYRQHTDETGQAFAPAALDLAWELTQGQPWLVNALAYEACFKIKENRDRDRPITAAILEQAKENLILRRDTHLDQLADKLQEARVRRVIEPLLLGQDAELPPEDVQYVLDLGLIRRQRNGEIDLANRIYQEVIPRELAWGFQMGISQQTAWYVGADGTLDMAKLLAAFQDFFQEHSEHWLARFDYQEAGPQLLLMAFLQRIVNAGGSVGREYGLGRGRVDLLVRWKLPRGGEQQVALELKLLRKDLTTTVARGLEQTADYMDRMRAPEGHLVIFDRTTKPWPEKLFRRQEQVRDYAITVWGM